MATVTSRCLVPRLHFECEDARRVIRQAIGDLIETFIEVELTDWCDLPNMAEASLWKDEANAIPTRLFVFVRRNHCPRRLSSVTLCATGADEERIEEIFDFICKRLKDAGCMA